MSYLAPHETNICSFNRFVVGWNLSDNDGTSGVDDMGIQRCSLRTPQRVNQMSGPRFGFTYLSEGSGAQFLNRVHEMDSAQYTSGDLVGSSLHLHNAVRLAMGNALRRHRRACCGPRRMGCADWRHGKRNVFAIVFQPCWHSLGERGGVCHGTQLGHLGLGICRVPSDTTSRKAT